jgi:hypothetical protein
VALARWKFKNSPYASAHFQGAKAPLSRLGVPIDNVALAHCLPFA